MDKEKNKEETKVKKERKVLKIILKILVQILLLVNVLIAFGLNWAFEKFDNCTLEKILFQLSEPLNGTSEEVIKDGILNIVVKGIIVWSILNVIYFVVFRILKNKFKNEKDEKNLKVVFIMCVLIGFIAFSSIKADLKGYIESLSKVSTLIEDYYVETDDVLIKFPEEKRNLIYIVLESMEVSFMDKENGGIMDENLIPEITTLMKENISFTNKENVLGGAYDVAGTGWTIGALVSQSSGLPLKIAGFNTANNPNENFMPGAVTLGDILKEYGYNQLFICGSPIEFGGRDNYYSQHGDYEIFDYNLAVEEKIYTDEKKNWGFIDNLLYGYAKEKILDLSQKDEPFNVTILTADTHHPDGYLCEDCENKWNDKYKNVISCASKQVYNFVEWIKEQDFYENTTIVILGDHPTMATCFSETVPDDYDRTTVNCFINSAIEPENKDVKQITTMDYFPTILASIGAEIEGDRLGIGTNLFSSKKTLGDELGIEYLDNELSLKSNFYIDKIIKGNE